MPLKNHVAALEALIASTPFVTATSIPHMFLMEVRSQRSEIRGQRACWETGQFRIANFEGEAF
jgi:hypothetical protein